MRFPNKVTTYKQSIISKFPLILKELEKQDYSVSSLYGKVGKKMDGPEEYIQVLDCLFFLGEIILLPGGDILHYAKRDIL